MRRLLPLAFSLLTLAACGDDAQCVIDTDCELGFYCSDNTCITIGNRPDAETPADGGGSDGDVEDGAVEDGAVADTSTGDAGADDASADDAGDDAACSYAATYTLTPAPGNPPECDALALTSCTVTEADPPQVDCGTFAASCELSGCVCSGIADVGGTMIAFSFDFTAGTLSANSCDYSLASF